MTANALLPDSNPDRRETLGQYFTPTVIGDFMASFFERFPSIVRVLDAGAGSGALSEAFVRRACHADSRIRRIELTAWEIDAEVIPQLRSSMEQLHGLCSRSNIDFQFEVRQGDFVLESEAMLSAGLYDSIPNFDAAIVNPPYRKISSNSSERCALRKVGIETSNLYSGFVGLICRLLANEGQLVAITPRSFCNGPYFRPFRQQFLKCMELTRLHLFESRSAAFRDDRVLQENVIYHAIKRKRRSKDIVVSSSSGEAGAEVSARRWSFGQIVHSGDKDHVIHIPDANQPESKCVIGRMTSTLESLGVAISTGRVVDFRLKESLQHCPDSSTAPLLYPCHFREGIVNWPLVDSRKPNAIKINDRTRPWLVPAETYVLTKRFSAKEERRRVVACLFDSSSVNSKLLGIENHLNYFHAGGRGLEPTLALGLLAYLNSTMVDRYFRTFSGHTQVNATDLRKLRYPNRTSLLAIAHAMPHPGVTQDQIDEIVTSCIDGR